MLLVTDTDSSVTQNWTAPRGKQFHIDSIFCAVWLAGDNTIFFFDQFLKRDPIDTEQKQDAFISFSMLSTGNFQARDLDIKTKYISQLERVLNAGGNLYSVNFYIYGDLIPISRAEALWQFIRNKSNSREG